MTRDKYRCEDCDDGNNDHFINTNNYGVKNITRKLTKFNDLYKNPRERLLSGEDTTTAMTVPK